MSEYQEVYREHNLSDVVDLKHGYQFRDEDFVEEGIPVIKISNVKGTGLDTKSVTYVSSNRLEEFENVVIKNNDILMSLTGNIGRVVVVSGLKGPVFQNYRVGKFEPLSEDLDKDFLACLLSSESLFDQLEQYSNQSAQANFGKQDLDKLKVIIPEAISTQQKIAKILSTVDNLIEKTQTLIEKYTAIKQGMMADLFTCGIDMTTGDTSNSKGGKLRPSVEDAPELYKQTELGWVPKEWEVKNLGELSEKVTSGSRDWAAYYADEGDLFVRISNLTREHINFRWKSIRYVDIGNGSEGERTRLAEGDILISITADLGIIGVVPSDFGRAFINQHTALVRLEKEVVNPRFIGNFLHSYAGQLQFEKFNDSGAKAGLNLPTVASLACILPSLDEQALISERIDSIDIQIEMYKVELSKYQSQKKGLMQDLLTGKVRVV